jgi:hypothetical protein
MTGNLRTWNRSLKQKQKKVVQFCTTIDLTVETACRIEHRARSLDHAGYFAIKKAGGGGGNGRGKEVQAATSVLKTRLISLVGKNCEMRGNQLRHCGRRKMGGEGYTRKKGRDIPRLLQLLEEPPRHCHQ